MVVWNLFDPNILDVLNRYLRGLKRFYYNKKKMLQCLHPGFLKKKMYLLRIHESIRNVFSKESLTKTLN